MSNDWVDRRPIFYTESSHETKNSTSASLVRVCLLRYIIGCCARDERPETYCIPVAGRREKRYTWLKQKREEVIKILLHYSRSDWR